MKTPSHTYHGINKSQADEILNISKNILEVPCSVTNDDYDIIKKVRQICGCSSAKAAAAVLKIRTTEPLFSATIESDLTRTQINAIEDKIGW